MVYFIWKVDAIMRNDKLSVQPMNFAVSIINPVKLLKESKKHIISNQIGKCEKSTFSSCESVDFFNYSFSNFIISLTSQSKA